jgi:hypothetical protein
MKPTRLVAVLVGLLSLIGGLAGTASATTVSDCQVQLSALQGNTAAAESSFANPKDFARLGEKLVEASEKLSQGKNEDAIQKLDDFRTTLNLLATAPKPKVDPAVAEGLRAEAFGVIECISTIGTA